MSKVVDEQSEIPERADEKVARADTNTQKDTINQSDSVHGDNPRFQRQKITSRWSSATCLRATSYAFLVLAVVILFIELFRHGGNDSVVRFQPETAFRSAFTLHMRITNFDLASGTVDGLVRATVDAGMYRRMGDPFASLPGETNFGWSTQYERSVITVPVKVFEAKDQPYWTGASWEPISMQFTTNTSRFPFDRYIFQAKVASTREVKYQEVRMPRLAISTGPELAEYELVITEDKDKVQLRIDRKGASIIRVALITLSPILLLWALILLGNRLKEDFLSLFLEVSVGLLALLSLRQVIVPDEINTNTLVDVFLGVEFIGFLALMAHHVAGRVDALRQTQSQ